MIKKRIAIVFGMLAILSILGTVYAEKIGIDIQNNYVDTGEISFTITLYDDNTNKINGAIDYQIKDYYSAVVYEGKTESGKLINFKLPEDAV